MQRILEKKCQKSISGTVRAREKSVAKTTELVAALGSSLPIPKGNEHESPSNYRPISLLSVTSKLLERHFYRLITDYLSDNHPLANTQWGFQLAKSTVSALLSTTYDWLEKMEAGRNICSVFLNLKKAFDTVPH